MKELLEKLIVGHEKCYEVTESGAFKVKQLNAVITFPVCWPEEKVIEILNREINWINDRGYIFPLLGNRDDRKKARLKLVGFETESLASTSYNTAMGREMIKQAHLRIKFGNEEAH